jgi:hypothetical protein
MRIQIRQAQYQHQSYVPTVLANSKERWILLADSQLKIFLLALATSWIPDYFVHFLLPSTLIMYLSSLRAQIQNRICIRITKRMRIRL